MGHVADRGGDAPPREVEELRPVVADRIPGQVDGAEALPGRRLGHRPELPGVGLDVEQQPGELDATDAVGQRVVDLHHQPGPAALQPLDERELPERTIAVEAGHAGLAGELQHRRQRLRGRRLEPADVPRDVEVGIDDPAGRGQPQWWQHDPVAEPRNQPRGALEPVRQLLPVRAPLQDQHAHHRRPQQRVLLHVPGEGVAVAHVDLRVLGQRSHLPDHL